MPQVSKKNDLVEHGLKVVHEHGFAASGVADIAAAAGAPKGSFYNHFASKEDFGRTIIDRYVAGDREKLTNLRQEGETPGRERLRGYFEWLRGQARSRRYGHGCLLGNLTGEVGASTVLRHELRVAFSEWGSMLADLVDDGVKDGSIVTSAHPHALADVLIDAWEGARLRAKLDRRGVALDQFMEVTFEALVPGVAQAHG